jgi:hypothetical protein
MQSTGRGSTREPGKSAVPKTILMIRVNSAEQSKQFNCQQPHANLTVP